MKLWVISDEELESVSEENWEKTVSIILQWKQAKYKTIEENKVTCNWVEKCNINLNSEVKGYKKKSNLTYKWNFWNSETSEKSNPPAIWYETWEYKITLEIYEKEELFWKETFEIIVTSEEKEQDSETPSELKWLLYINKIMPNPIWADEKERIELINNSDKNINIKWCELDDDTTKWSKPYKFEDNFIIKAWKTKKIYKTLTKLNLNNDIDSVNLFCNSALVDSLARNFKVKEGYYLSHDRLFTKNFKAKVIKVVDWDTLDLELENWDKVTIRMIWVDTPENNAYKQIFQEYWKQASVFTKKHLEWKEILVEVDSENTRDIYGRLLWYVIINWENFNKTLLEQGIAKPYFRYPFKYMEEFDKAYKKAQKEKLWIWADKEAKKILEAEIKQEIAEQEEEETEELKQETSLKDENQNEIPDEFEVISEIDEETGEVKIDEKKSKENYDNYVEKTLNNPLEKQNPD